MKDPIIKKMEKLGVPAHRIQMHTGFGDEIYGEMDPNSGLEAKTEPGEVNYSDEEDPGTYL